MPKRFIRRSKGPGRKKPRMAKKARISRGLANRAGTVSIRRTYCYGTWFPSTVGTIDFWRQWQFTLGDLPSVAEFTQLWDQYRINRIKVTFRPRYDNFSGNDTTDTTVPGITNQWGTQIHVIVDQRTTTAPSGTYIRSNFNSFLENGKVKSYMGNKPVSVYFKPAVPQTVGTVSGSAFLWAPWLQTSQTAVQHFGFQTFVTDNGFVGQFGNSFDIFIEFFMQFRGLK